MAGRASVAVVNPGTSSGPSNTLDFIIADPSKQNQTIAFAPLPNRALGSSPFTISASASSGLPVTFTASRKCSVHGATVTLGGAGSCTITAHQDGDATYNPAPPVARTFQISASMQGPITRITLYLPLVVR